jgi:hypothetical protein
MGLLKKFSQCVSVRFAARELYDAEASDIIFDFEMGGMEEQSGK